MDAQILVACTKQKQLLVYTRKGNVVEELDVIVDDETIDKLHRTWM